MGQTMSEPVTSKESSSCANAMLKVGSSCMQGWRISMEDVHTQLLSMPGDREAAFFGVYDGHGGTKVAQYAGLHLHRKIVSQPAYKNGKLDEAMISGFLSVDDDMFHDESIRNELAGSTAVVCLIKNRKIYCANVGDSRAVASVCGRAQPLSYDHKPTNELETKRIQAAGGWVEFNRVNGNLALSRALGDFAFKRNNDRRPEEQIITACPDVIIENITDEFEFIIMACDGVWDVLSNQEAVEFVRVRIASGMEPDTICEELIMRCLSPSCQLSGVGCDNMTAILICFLPQPSTATPLPAHNALQVHNANPNSTQGQGQKRATSPNPSSQGQSQSISRTQLQSAPKLTGAGTSGTFSSSSLDGYQLLASKCARPAANGPSPSILSTKG